MLSRKILAVATVLLLAPGLMSGANAQSYPTKSIEVIVPFPAGGTADILARIMGERMAESFGQPVVVVNKPGAAGGVGAHAAASAPPDGYTLFFGTTGVMTMNQWVHKALPYDPAKDFVPVSNFAFSPFVLVAKPGFEPKTIKDLIVLAKEQPGVINYGSFGVGSSAHLTGELMQKMAGIELKHVPYKGAPPALKDVAGGHIETMFSMLPAALALVKGNKVRAVAVASEQRNPALPDVPTFSESGLPNFTSGSWYGVFAPAGTSNEIVAKLNGEIKRILELPEVRDRLASEGAEPVYTSPEDFAAQIAKEAEHWQGIVKAAKLQAK